MRIGRNAGAPCSYATRSRKWGLSVYRSPRRAADDRRRRRSIKRATTVRRPVRGRVTAARGNASADCCSFGFDGKKVIEQKNVFSVIKIEHFTAYERAV